MNRRRFLVALAALPIAAKFGGLIPHAPAPYYSYTFGKDAVSVLGPMTEGEIGKQVSYNYVFTSKMLDTCTPRYVQVENVAQPA